MDLSQYITYCCDTSPQMTLMSDFSEMHTSEDEIVNQFIKYLKAKFRINIIAWEPQSSSYPKYMYLGGDRGILSYISFRYVQSDASLKQSDYSSESQEILKTICTAASQLDRPVFYVYLMNTKDYTGLLFETDEQIRERWLTTHFSEPIYTPILSEMGSFDNLLSIWLNMKQSTIKK